MNSKLTLFRIIFHTIIVIILAVDLFGIFEVKAEFTTFLFSILTLILVIEVNLNE